GQPAVLVGGHLLRAETGVSLVRLRRLLVHARVVLRGHLAHVVDDLEATGAATDHHDHARPVTGSDEDVPGPRRAVDEVPGAKAALLLLDDEHALAGDDEEVLLPFLAVVHAVALSRHEDLNAETEAGPVLTSLQDGVLPALLAADPRGITGVQHEPAF